MKFCVRGESARARACNPSPRVYLDLRGRVSSPGRLHLLP